MKRQQALFAAALAGIALAVFSSPALADCDVNGEPFLMHKNDKSAHTIVTDGKGCDLNFSTDAKTKFRSATVVSGPKNGKLVKVEGLELAYHPKPGFKGQDGFVLKVCGSSPLGRGCSTLNYTTTVN